MELFDISRLATVKIAVLGLFFLFSIGVLFLLYKVLAYFGKSDADEFRAVRCPQCETRRKPLKTGTIRNLVELEMRCPRCGHISWDIPPKTNLSTRPTDRDNLP